MFAFATRIGKRHVSSGTEEKGHSGAPIAPQMQWVNDPGWAELAGGCNDRRC